MGLFLNRIPQTAWLSRGRRLADSNRCFIPIPRSGRVRAHFTAAVPYVLFLTFLALTALNTVTAR